MSRFFCTAAAFVTNSPSFGEYFVYSKPYPVDGATTNSIYDAVGSGMVETQYVMIANDQTNALGGYGVTAAFGNTNLPTWCTEPIPPPVIINATYHLRGMVVDTTTYIIRTYRKWIVPGGFTFY
jgi:hypothetical protein